MTSDGISFCKVYEDGGGYVCVTVEDEPTIDANVSRYLDSGGTRDSLVHLTCADGAPYVMRASAVTSWTISTPASRARAAELESAFKPEPTAPWEQGD